MSLNYNCCNHNCTQVRALLLLLPTLSPTLSPTLDIVLSLGLDLLINFFEELRILDVKLIIFFKTALDFSKIVFNSK